MKELTFVVQGPVGSTTAENLQSIRHHYPASPIVLSTWEGSKTDGLVFDKLLLNKDPGGKEMLPGLFNNVNRQIVSTVNGLKVVDTPYSVKFRTDMLVASARLIPRDEPGTLLGSKITALNLFFRDPVQSCKLFHIGDILHLGKTEDLVKVWDIPLDDFAAPTKGLETLLFNPPHFKNRHSPEQFIWMSFLRKCGHDVSLDYPEQFSWDMLRLSDRSMAENFILKTYEELGVLVPSRLMQNGDISTVYAQHDLDRILSKGSQVRSATSAFMRKHRRELSNRIRHPIRWMKSAA